MDTSFCFFIILYLSKQDKDLPFFSDYLFQSQDGQEHSGPFIRRCTPDKKEVITLFEYSNTLDKCLFVAYA